MSKFWTKLLINSYICYFISNIREICSNWNLLNIPTNLFLFTFSFFKKNGINRYYSLNKTCCSTRIFGKTIFITLFAAICSQSNRICRTKISYWRNIHALNRVFISFSCIEWNKHRIVSHLFGTLKKSLL